MIIFDTETTGFISAIDAPLKTQPKITEIFALRVHDETLEEIDSFNVLVDPGESLTEEITRITGITNEMVRGAGSFMTHSKSIQEFWLGERVMCGHNVSFDCDMLEIELRRIGKQNYFPWTPTRFCTVEMTEHYEGHRLSLSNLHRYLFGEPFENAHRAEPDVRATHRCLIEIKKRGDLPKIW